MKYVGIQTQIQRNNTLSVLLLLGFPTILLAMVWLFLFIIHYISNSTYFSMSTVNYQFLMTIPWVVVIVGIWFIIAYFSNTSMIRNATGAYSITRMDNPRIYNIVENLTMTCGMPMPQINIVDDPQLNAFASGIDERSYTVTVTTGLMDCLNDEELAGVVGHELTHIRNRHDGDSARPVASHRLWCRPSQKQQREECRLNHTRGADRGTRLCRHRLFLHSADTLCHLTQTRIHG